MSRVALGCAAALALAVAGCRADDARTPPPRGGAGSQARAAERAAADPRRAVLLASGRDDHGLRARSHVALLRAPRFAAPRRARIPDGALVRVLEVRNEWHRVRALGRPGAQGWVHDFDLRGTVHIVGPHRHGAARCAATLSVTPGASTTRRLRAGVQAEMLATTLRRGVTWIRVRTIPARAHGWVASSAIRELPGCARAQERARASHHHHHHD